MYIALLLALVMAFNFTPANFVPAPAKHADNWIIHARISSPYIYDIPWEEAINKIEKNGVNVIIDWAGFKLKGI